MVLEEVLPLAQSRGSLNSPDWQDISTIIRTFEGTEQVDITVELTHTMVMGASALLVAAKAYSNKKGEQAAQPLASASATCSATGLRTLEAAVIHVLYVLDFQIAVAELGKAEVKPA